MVVLAAIVIAIVGTKPFASSWNDGSRLATVESLVDYGTLAIDDSMFTNPALADDAPTHPYGRWSNTGTLDKMLINGHFYSDKSPVPTLGMAALYAALQRTTGLIARRNPAAFCYWMSLLSSGTSYVLAVLAMYLLAERILGAPAKAAAVTASFAIATTALTYSRAVNIHVVLLGLMSWIVVIWHRLAVSDTVRGRASVLLLLGVLSGAAYSCDLGFGPFVALASLLFVVWTYGWGRAVLLVAAGAAPFVLLFHAMNFHIGGTFTAVGAVPAYFDYPGSSHTAERLTGSWNHPHGAAFAYYLVDMLFGGRGFLFHNLPLLLGVGMIVTFRNRWSRLAEWPAIVCGSAVIIATWLTYGALSTNYSGASASIRWFVPWLPPGFLVVCVLLRERSSAWVPFAALSLWGMVIGIVMWLQGPWTVHRVPHYWILVSGGAVSCVWSWLYVRSRPASVRLHF